MSVSMEGLRIYNKLAAKHFRDHAYTAVKVALAECQNLLRYKWKQELKIFM